MVAILTPQEVVDLVFAPLDSAPPSPADSQHLGTFTDASAQGCWTTCTAKIRAFALECLRLGWDRCSGKFEEMRQVIEGQIELLGEQADEMRDRLRRDLHSVLENYVEYASSLIPLETTVGGEKLRLSKVDVSYKLVLSGSLGLSLEGLFKVMGQNEVSIVGSYSR